MPLIYWVQGHFLFVLFSYLRDETEFFLLFFQPYLYIRCLVLRFVYQLQPLLKKH